jgi:hypothetical protein
MSVQRRWMEGKKVVSQTAVLPSENDGAVKLPVSQGKRGLKVAVRAVRDRCGSSGGGVGGGEDRN